MILQLCVFDATGTIHPKRIWLCGKEEKCWSNRTRDPNIRNPDATSCKPLAISLSGDNLLQNTHFILYCQKIPISKYPFHRCIDWSLVTVSDKPFTPSLPTPARAIWGFKQFNFSFFSQRNDFVQWNFHPYANWVLLHFSSFSYAWNVKEAESV